MQKKIKLSLMASLFINSSLYGQTDLGTITVTSATKAEQSIKDITSNIEVITSIELEEKHITTITEALNLISGINFTSNGGLGKVTSVNLRGFDTNRVLLLVDGIRYNDITGMSGARFEHLMISDIEQIEVIKGAQSGIWGADATAGVINIITKKAEKDFNAEINFEHGSFNTNKLNINAGYSQSKYYVKANLNKVKTDGFTSYAEKGVNIDSYEDDGYENETYNIKYGYNFDNNNKVDLSHTVEDSKTQTDSTSGDSDSSSTSNSMFNKVDYQYKNQDLTTNINYKQSVFNRDTSTGSEFDGVVKEYEIKSKYDYLNKSSFIIAGINYKNFEQKNNLNKSFNNKAFFITNSNIINNKTTITESLRIDHYSIFSNKTTGKLGINHNFDNELSISSNAGTAYTIPTIYQLYQPGSTFWGVYSEIGNENLKPDETKSFDFSVGFKNLKVTYFYNKVKDMIDWYDPDGWSAGSIPGQYDNIKGISKFKGIEIDFKENLNDHFLISLNYTKLSAKNKDGEFLKRRPEQTVKYSIDYYGIEKTHLGLNGEYIGNRYNEDDKQGEQTGKYTLLNFIVNYDISQKIKAYGKIDNLTNKYYQVVDGYATSPRAFYAGIKVTF